MIILGHNDIEYEKIFHIKKIEDIKNTEPNSIVFFEYNLNILKYCQNNNIKSFVKINSIKEAIFCNSLEAYYLLVDSIIAYDIQQLAQNYMFDSKIIQSISNENEIEQIAKNNIDGIIYKDTIKELNI